MPGRVSTRTSTASQLPCKPSVQPLASRRTTASRVSSPTVAIPDEGPSSILRTQICIVFGEVQRSTAGHRKLAVSLRKIQEACCYEPANPKSNTFEDFGEDNFNVEVARCVIRLMGVKKSEGVGDRIVKFLGLFLKHASDKGHLGSLQKPFDFPIDNLQISPSSLKTIWTRLNRAQKHLPRAS